MSLKYCLFLSTKVERYTFIIKNILEIRHLRIFLMKIMLYRNKTYACQMSGQQLHNNGWGAW